LRGDGPHKKVIRHQVLQGFCLSKQLSKIFGVERCKAIDAEVQ
jgi:hypothetical protein